MGQVDDQLPCIGSAAQRRPDGSGLAFSRAKDWHKAMGPQGLGALGFRGLVRH